MNAYLVIGVTSVLIGTVCAVIAYNTRRASLRWFLFAVVIILFAVVTLRFVSPYLVYRSLVSRLIEDGVPPRLAPFMAPFPALLFMSTIGGLCWAAFISRRIDKALGWAAALAVIGIAEYYFAKPSPEELFNHVTQEPNFGWYREIGGDIFSADIVLVPRWWKVNGVGYPVADLTPPVAEEYKIQQKHKRESVAHELAQEVERRKVLSDLQQRQKEEDATIERLRAKEAEIDAALGQIKAREAELDTLIQKAKEVQPRPPMQAPPTAAAKASSLRVVTGDIARSTEELPKRGVNSTEALPLQEPNEVPVGRTVTVPIAEGYYSVTVKSYKRVGTSVYLYLQYKNDLPELVEFIMDAKGNTMSDNVGNQYAASVASFVGGLEARKTDVLRGTFANAVLRFDGVSAEAKAATGLRTLVWWSSPSHPRSTISMGRRSYGEFDNIPLSPQTP
jgi:hypothetical protein